MINQWLNVLIASIYVICNIVYTGQQVGWQVLMLYKKVFLFVI